MDGLAVDGSDDLLGNLFLRTVLAQQADYISPFTFPKIAGGNVLIALRQTTTKIVDCQPAGREIRWFNDDLQLLASPTTKKNVGHSRNAFKLGLDHIFGEFAVFPNVHVSRHQLQCDRMVLGQFLQSIESQTGVSGSKNSFTIGLEFGMGSGELFDLFLGWRDRT